MRSLNRRARILVADDNPLVSATLCRLLAAMGHLPVAVEDGMAAVEKAMGERYDLILMDVEMPRKDGITACLEILMMKPTSAIVLVTGSDDMFEQGRMAGAKAVLHKPVSTESLREIVELAMPAPPGDRAGIETTTG